MSSTWIGISLGVFVTLYLILGVVDVWLMRRFAGRDPDPDPAASPAAPEPQPAVGY